MITLEQAKEYAASLGAESVPDFLLQLWVDAANSINECLDANYPPSVAQLIQLYVVAILMTLGSDKYVSSQTAPSGASQSFRFKPSSTLDFYQLLRGLDKKGCASGIVPPDPSVKKRGLMYVVSGGCH